MGTRWKSCVRAVLFTDVAVRLVVVSSHSDGAAFQHGHYPLEVALVDDATVVRAGLWVVRVELLLEKTEKIWHDIEFLKSSFMLML